MHDADAAVAVEDAPLVQGAEAGPALRGPRQGLSEGGRRPVPAIKWAALILLLGIYYLAPWLRWDRGPGVPDQAVLIDMPGRRAYFFWIEIWPQEVYYLTGLLILGAFGLFLATSLAGRVWCGFTCPQTVWTDLFMWVERRIEGDRNARMRLDKAPLVRARRSLKKVAKHAAWLLIAALTGGAWIMYFNDAPTVTRAILDRQRLVRPVLLLRPVHRHDLPAGRLGARAGLHLHVPLAALPGGDARRGQLRRHLPEVARRAARAAQEGPGLDPARRLHRLQPVRRGLPDGHRHPRRACSWNASAAACASTPATT